METLGSVPSVVAASRDEAAAEVEKLERDAPKIAVEPVVIGDRESRIAAVHRENRERIAQQEWDARRAIVEQREAWIARVRAAARERWSDRDWLELAKEALERIPGDDCTLCHPERSEGTGGRGGSLEKLTGKKITFKPAPLSGGCIVTSGGVTFDNTFEARELRLESEWRRALSALYRA